MLEALGSTQVNLLFDVGFNREVGEEAAIYWTKEPGNLAALIESVSGMDPEEKKKLGEKAKQRIITDYSQKKIAQAYEKTFLGEAP